MLTFRIEIGNKKNFPDPRSGNLLKDIKDIGINGVKHVDIVDVFTLTGDVTAKKAKDVARTLLADSVSQECRVYPCALRDKRFAQKNTVEIASNPGVMDPVRDSVIKAMNDMGIVGVSVTTSKKYIFAGRFNAGTSRNVADKLLYNKLIQHIVTHSETAENAAQYDFSYTEVPVITLDDPGLSKLSYDARLYLSLAEMKVIRKHYKTIGRNPSDCELETIAQTWSEHCKHKTMLGDILFDGKLVRKLLKNTVMKATIELKKPWCISVFKDNAGIIEFDDKHNVCFKVETHNHPSALEPYGGAGTGIGGVIRDTLGTGLGAKPIANTDVFCFGFPDAPNAKIPKGALHPKRVMKGVVSGVRDYGNKMGIPTVNGAVYFDERYTGNPLVYCGNIGIMPKACSFKKVSSGDLIVAVGGRTGRDGIHGATFSSSELTHESETISATAVQIGDPITEKKVLDTLLKARDLGLYDAVTDCGAGGFSSAVGEMGEETGAEVYLEKAPLKYEGLKPWEIWVSEAQERMVLAVKPKKLKKLLSIFESENVEAVVIGKFTRDKKLKLFYKKHKVADLDMEFLHGGLPGVVRKAIWKNRHEDPRIATPVRTNYNTDLARILASWNISSKEWIIRQYDHEVQAGSVLKPLVGAENDGPSDAAVIRPVLTSNKGIVISNGINPRYGDIDPYWMAASVIEEAIRQIIAVGGDPDKIAILDNFCWGSTENPVELGKLVRASQACYDFGKAFGTPFISGKDSLNNEFNTGKGVVAIPSTLLISAIAVIDDVRKTISMDVKEPGNLIYVLGKTFQELGGSQYNLVNGLSGGVVPRVNAKVSAQLMRKLSVAIRKGLVVSCHDISDGGFAVSAAEMFFAGGYGADIDLGKLPRDRSVKRDDVVLFSESNGRFIAEVPAGKKEEFEKALRGVHLGFVGKVRKDKKMLVKGLGGKTVVNADIDKLKYSWQNTIRKVMHE
ncbi:MAG: phosphoribosylformylglycinamidine synthase subunit PurL [Candidatus Omnitrophica bacterium]|nr:phosphoribosylformylglycinamidine synthase subunit PurL [Candidatus Omnitrophota bacterium]